MPAADGRCWALTLFGVPVSDPLALLGHLAATLSVHWPLVLGALTPLADGGAGRRRPGDRP